MAATASMCVNKLRVMCTALPEVEERLGGEHDRHIAFTVRRRTFAYFTDDHHGDGMLALLCKAPPGAQQALVASEPERFFVPPYLGHRGWVGMRLDIAPVDWVEAEELLVESFVLCAPKALARRVEESCGE